VLADVRDAFGSELNTGQQSALLSRVRLRRRLALIVDEFAPLLDLKDGYWAKEGRISVDVGIGGGLRAPAQRKRRASRKTARLMYSPAPDGQAIVVDQS
jgi:hypothetical protein